MKPACSIPLLYCLTLFAPLTANGEQILLAELGITSPSAANGNYSFTAGAFYGTSQERTHDWRIRNGVAGQVLHADAAMLEGFNDILANGAYPLVFQSVGSHCGDIGQCFGIQYEVVVDGPERSGWFGTRHAASRGPGITGYRITAIERSLAEISQTLRIFGEVVPAGDYNDNGVVDAADYVLWRKRNQTQIGYVVWRTTYGDSAAASSPAAVPEPGAFALLLVGLHGMGIRALRRRSAS